MGKMGKGEPVRVLSEALTLWMSWPYSPDHLCAICQDRGQAGVWPDPLSARLLPTLSMDRFFLEWVRSTALLCPLVILGRALWVVCTAC